MNKVSLKEYLTKTLCIHEEFKLRILMNNTLKRLKENPSMTLKELLEID